MITTIQQLLNSGSKLMNVNGSGTPKTFTYTASAPMELVTSIICVLKDEGTTSFGNFGAISPLTNGVLMQATQGGSTRTIATMKDNADVCMVFSQNQFGNGAVLSILSIVSPEGFGDTNNCFVGLFTPVNPISLASGDTFTVTIQDNLSSIDILQMSLNVCVD